MFYLPKFKKLTVITLIEILILGSLGWLLYQHFFGDGISLKIGTTKCYTEKSFTITDSTMAPLLNQGETVKELQGYFDCNKAKRRDAVTIILEDRGVFVRKVVAVSSNKISFEGAFLKVGGNIEKNSEGEPYLFADTIRESFEGKVPKGTYLVLSNQTSPSSFDSRQFGFVTEEQLRGKIVK